jgi:hypothetical protein
MPLTTAQYERRRRALELAAQTSRGDDCETDILERADGFLAFLEGRTGDDTIVIGEATFGPDIALTPADVDAVMAAIGRRIANGGRL